MSDLIAELEEFARSVDVLPALERLRVSLDVLKRFDMAAEKLARAWSGSWLGYHADIYYADFQVPPPEAYFSQQDGLRSHAYGPSTTGDWRKYSSDAVTARLLADACSSDDELTAISDQADLLGQQHTALKDELLAILETIHARQADSVIRRLVDRVQAHRLPEANMYVAHLVPKQSHSSDHEALLAGLRTPAHVHISATVWVIQTMVAQYDDLIHMARLGAKQLRRAVVPLRDETGRAVFIGHGRSKIWLDLKDFVADRLHLPWNEFNSVPIAGIPNAARLSELLDASVIAFLVMTAEDEQPSGTLHPRLNVVHEAGLFQGRLGFTRAIILLEEGCEEFSNIHGLGQLRFPKGNIRAAFEDVRQVLEREGFLVTD